LTGAPSVLRAPPDHQAALDCQRWQKQNQLTPAFPVNAFGRKLRIFPAFALGQVVALA
jgi:hypothetical protein